MRLRRMVKLGGTLAVLAVVGLVGVTGCGSNNDTSSSGAAAEQIPGQVPQRDAADDGAVDDSAADLDEFGAERGQRSTVIADERHVVRSARLTLDVDDVAEAAAETRAVAERYDGFVSDEQTEDERAGLTLRVDAERLDDALGDLAELGKVTRREQQAEDVTEQVVDVQARLANQRASVQRVRAMLDRADTIGEIVQVESELTQRQAELESLEQRAAALAAQTELATVSVNLYTDAEEAEDEDERGFLSGLSSGWDAFVSTGEVLLTISGALLPFAVAIAVPVTIAVLLEIGRAHV